MPANAIGVIESRPSYNYGDHQTYCSSSRQEKLIDSLLTEIPETNQATFLTELLIDPRPIPIGG